MPQHAEALLGDVVGSPMTPDSVGVEIPNKASRRRVDFNEYGMCRVQWADSQGAGVTGLRVEYSLDDGAAWGELIPTVTGQGGPYDNDCGDWAPIPPDVLNAPYNVLIRAMLTGSAGSTKVTYVTVQLR